MFSPPPANSGAFGAAPAAAGDLIKDSSDRTFMADVIEASRTVPVIVDFWAPWCGPCKQLGPVLEKVVRAAKGAVRMVKIDTDKNPMIAQQLRVQSIPAVYAFFQGRPVDAFVGAQPESQIKQWVDRLIKAAGGAAGGDDLGAVLEEALAHARQALDAGDAAAAADIYGQILQHDPAHAAAYAGMVRCLIAMKDLARAREMIAAAPAELAKSPELAAATSAIDVAEQAQAVGPVTELMERLARDKNDHEARYDLAMALYAAGKREAAVDELLELVRRDRTWNEDAARKQLVKLFEAFGPTDPLTVQSRRKLSTILFS
ncbi:thioredoxin [Azospirillum halopraeferens]|uniref:thioredoxin n=1 Tax=Azospirillum halopraeferens TaxID=34010 RepID=UPI00040C0478|nr:thioredoxin [Azospirillum halopraeferens]